MMLRYETLWIEDEQHFFARSKLCILAGLKILKYFLFEEYLDTVLYIHSLTEEELAQRENCVWYARHSEKW